MSDIALERKVVWLAAMIQLANVLDYMIILPLGPDLTTHIGVPSSKMGLVNGIYTIAAAVSAALLARYLDHFDRKKAVLFFLSGLIIATVLTAFSRDIYSLLFFRMLAGSFGGPVTALSFAMLVDMVPVERRGRGMAIVSSAFTISSIFGIPLGLSLALEFNWQMPFYVIAAFGAFVALLIFILLPPMTGHLKSKEGDNDTVSLISLFKRRKIQLAFLLLSLSSFSAFLMIVSTINYFTFNLEYPREDLDILYFIGGIISFIAMMLTGRAIDLYGSRILAIITAIFYALVIADGFMHVPYMGPMLIFCLFMMCSAIMGVITSTIASKTPEDHERAAFMSLQTMFRHGAAGLAGLVASLILYDDSTGYIYNMPYTALITITCILLLPVIVIRLRNILHVN